MLIDGRVVLAVLYRDEGIFVDLLRAGHTGYPHVDEVPVTQEQLDEAYAEDMRERQEARDYGERMRAHADKPIPHLVAQELMAKLKAAQRKRESEGSDT